MNNQELNLSIGKTACKHYAPEFIQHEGSRIFGDIKCNICSKRSFLESMEN